MHWTGITKEDLYMVRKKKKKKKKKKKRKKKKKKINKISVTSL